MSSGSDGTPPSRSSIKPAICLFTVGAGGVIRGHCPSDELSQYPEDPKQTCEIV